MATSTPSAAVLDDREHILFRLDIGSQAIVFRLVDVPAVVAIIGAFVAAYIGFVVSDAGYWIVPVPFFVAAFVAVSFTKIDAAPFVVVLIVTAALAFLSLR